MIRSLSVLLPCVLTLSNAEGATPEQVLRERLALTYPDVTTWEISPLKPSDAAGPLPDGHWRVLTVGPRSALALNEQTGSPHEVWFKVQGRASRLVAAVPLTARQTLTGLSLSTADVDIVGHRCHALPPTALAGTFWLAKNISPGTPVCDEDVRKSPDVVRGRAMTVRSGAGAVQVESSALALEDGVAGERIRARLVQGTAPFQVLVKGRGLGVVE